MVKANKAVAESAKNTQQATEGAAEGINAEGDASENAEKDINYNDEKTQRSISQDYFRTASAYKTAKSNYDKAVRNNSNVDEAKRARDNAEALMNEARQRVDEMRAALGEGFSNVAIDIRNNIAKADAAIADANIDKTMEKKTNSIKRAVERL